MKPYSLKKTPKGISGTRKSKVSCHRKRSLRVDKKAARRSWWNKNRISDEALEKLIKEIDVSQPQDL